MEDAILFPESNSYGFNNQKSHLSIAAATMSRSRRRRLKKKEKLRSLNFSSEDLGIVKPPPVPSTVPPVRLIQKEGASELLPFVAPSPYLSISVDDTVMKTELPPPVPSTAPPIRLIWKEGASKLPPFVAPPPYLSNSVEDAVMMTELQVLFLKSIQNFDTPPLSDSKGKAIASDLGKINRPFGALWNVDNPPLKKRMKWPEVSSLTAQGGRYYLRPHR